METVRPPCRHRSGGPEVVGRWCCVVVVVVSVLAMVGPAWPATSRPGSPPEGGRFLSQQDSLGYDDYRELDHDTQLERRESAKRWAKRVRETRRRAAQQVESSAAVRIYRQALDEAATVVGLCPYFPEGWLLYADVLNHLGYYVSAELCLDHAESTLAYERNSKHRRQLVGDLHGQRAVIAYNRGDWATSAA